MIEPLKPEPDEHEHYISGADPRCHESYTQGFHDGAYALAEEVLTVVRLLDADDDGRVDVDELLAGLQSYETKSARPCQGWTHEPKH